MQIANGFVTTCPEITHYILGITPAEAVMLKTMHNQYSNGTPLKNLVIVGEATEVDQYGKPLMIAERKPFKRAMVRMENGQPMVAEVPDWETTYTPSTKPRTQSEEANRLRRKYVGNVTVNGKTTSAWEASFGGGTMPRLPETFKEVEEIIGPVFTDARQLVVPEAEIVMDAVQEVVNEKTKRLGRPPKAQTQEPVNA